MKFRFAVDQHDVGFDSAIRRQNNGAIAKTLMGLDSFGDVDFPVGHPVTLSDLGISVGITSLQVLDN